MAYKLLFVDHAPALSGAEYILLLLLKHLDRDCWEPHLACTGGLLAERAAALGVTVHVVPLRRLRRSPRFLWDWPLGVCAVARLARRIGAVLLYANTVRAALYAAPAARLARLPFFWHMHDFWLSESRPRRLWADRLGKWLLCLTAHRVVAISGAVASQLPCRDETTVVYDGIEVERFDPGMDGRPFRARYGIPPDAPLVGTVGRLRPWKGQERFLRLAAQVAAQVPEAHFLVVGGEPFGVGDDYPQRLHRLAAELNLADRLTFTGHLEDVRPALAATDVFVHPGDPEPFGLVNVEAMALAKPVVAFAHGALPEIVADGETGVLVPPGDETALAEAVKTCLRDPARRIAMGKAGRRRVEESFRVRRMVEEIEKAL